MRKGAHVDPRLGRETLASYASRWLERAERRLRPSTLERYRTLERKYLRDALGPRRLASIKRGDVERLRDDLLARDKPRPTTVAQVLRFLHTLLGAAVADERIARNVAHVKPPKLPRTEQRFLSGQEVARLVAEMPDRWGAFALTAAYSGSAVR